VFEKKVLRRISRHERKQNGETYILRSSIICTLYNTVGMIKSGDEMGRTYSRHGR
jgi:hypothetical protein